MKNTGKYLLICLLIATAVHSSFGQVNDADKQVGWNKVQQLSIPAFALKDQESQLAGHELNRKVYDRMHAFQQALYAITTWIETYYPNGSKQPTPGYVLAVFVQTLYLEYAGHFEDAAARYTHQVPELLMALRQTHQLIPVYNHVGIDQWVNDKYNYYLAAGRQANGVGRDGFIYTLGVHRDDFDISIAQSADDAIQKSLKRVAYLLGDSVYRHVVSNQSDRYFIVKQTTAGLADSASENDPQQWADIYIRGIAKNMNLPLKKDSMAAYQLYSLQEPEVARTVIKQSLDHLGSVLKSAYITRPLTPITLATYSSSGRLPLTDTLFNDIFGEGRPQFAPMEIIRKQWPFRITLVTTPVDKCLDSVTRLIDRHAAIAWIVNDFKGKPLPPWLIGVVYLYENTSIAHRDYYPLYFLKSVITQKKWPAIETFVRGTGEENDPKDIFFRGYWAYFWWFLESKGLAKPIYAAIYQSSGGWTDEKSINLMKTISRESMEKMNKEFLDFIKSRPLIYIRDADLHWLPIANAYHFTPD